MSGKLISKQTVWANVKPLSAAAYQRLIKTAVQTRRGVITSITLIASALPKGYIIAKLPSKTVANLKRYLTSLPVAKRSAFVKGWISKNTVQLIVQYYKSGQKSRFNFTPSAIPKTAAKTAPKTVPRRVKPAPRRVPQKIQPRRAPPRRPPPRRQAPPLLATIPKALRPNFNKQKRIITIPVPSSSAKGSQILWKLMKTNISYGSRKVSFIFGVNFVASKHTGRMSAITLSQVIARLIQPYMRQQAKKIVMNQQITVTVGYVSAAVRKFFKNRKHSDIKAYLVWPKVKRP